MRKPDKFTLVPEEALAWLKAKKLKPGFDYRDVWQDEHRAAFTIAKMTQLDLLADVRQLVEAALENGRTFAQFRAELEPLLIKRGWWGQKLTDDPLTGETKLVQLGSDRRLRVIYDTNMRTSRAAGQWERIERTKRAMPYLIYTLGPSREHRADHVRWAGVCLPVDDPFWNTHMGPNGWGCKCGVRQVSRYEYDQMKQNGSIKTSAPPERYVKWVNKRTGEEESIPEGIDPGWAYNPGTARGRELDAALAQKQTAFDSYTPPRQ
ncbi:Mu-like phage morphogenesis protein [Trabulsiella guamensis ATCC 49490]|uniref:Mu-like phage morphogenesis protein n=1 Tax=Trabulsiella guamensis ATCC 49490 TaxID=1005994 RepID=A0A084Z873_9ENTR|nr:phage minor head protein [Trabulsiella guamensis]KFB93667.1 Mu-like phage morphogenesis protein [Trabulsiella guamensis ATCC 49490]